VGKINVKMFGSFSMSTETESLSDNENRSRKMWLLLAYLIFNRGRVIRQNELMEVLWSENDREVNSNGALKTLFYRIRSELNKLWDGAGKQLILSQGNGYIWNPDFEVELDCEKFSELNEKIIKSNGECLDDTMEMFRLYQGEFLERFASEFWVIPLAAYYHNIYIQNLLQTIPVMFEQQMYEEIAEFCRDAVLVEPFNEEIHGWLMQAYIAMEKQGLAIEVYQKFSDRLLSELGIMPSEEIRAVYHEATKSNNQHMLTVSMLQEQLKEDSSSPGALVCEYDFFRVLYFSMARSVLRSGIAVHMVLITVKDRKGGTFTEKKREKIMENMKEVLHASLRRGDSAARCSAQQYVVMLPRANFENSQMVCERILRAYYQRYSRADAELHYDVFPLQPDEKENFGWIQEKTER